MARSNVEVPVLILSDVDCIVWVGKYESFVNLRKKV